jgi:uncharacterized protein
MATDYSTAAPGIHLEEPPVAGPISGVGTSVAALIGVPVTQPAAGSPALPVTSWNAYKSLFGEYKSGQNLPYAVRGFFDNGGTSAYVIPVKSLLQNDLDAALDQLTRLLDVSLVCVPGLTDSAVQASVLKHCEDMRDRFAILDGVQTTAPAAPAGTGTGPGPATPSATPVDPTAPDSRLVAQRAALLSENGFGALYWPWIAIPNPLAADPVTIAVPPSGHVAGVMARCDATVGVHRAPANEQVRGAVALDYPLNDTEQGKLNAQNVNALRQFPGGPPLVWGARTLTADVPWRFVNVRRLVSYIEDSLVDGLRWALFAPNTTGLWKGLERSITEFLTRIWEAGGLFGRSAKEAFYVTIDESNNPESVRELGQVFVEIGLAVTRPAEHIILRIGLWDGGATISEG